MNLVDWMKSKINPKYSYSEIARRVAIDLSLRRCLLNEESNMMYVNNRAKVVENKLDLDNKETEQQ